MKQQPTHFQIWNSNSCPGCSPAGIGTFIMPFAVCTGICIPPLYPGGTVAFIRFGGPPGGIPGCPGIGCPGIGWPGIGWPWKPIGIGNA